MGEIPVSNVGGHAKTRVPAKRNSRKCKPPTMPAAIAMPRRSAKVGLGRIQMRVDKIDGVGSLIPVDAAVTFHPLDSVAVYGNFAISPINIIRKQPKYSHFEGGAV